MLCPGYTKTLDLAHGEVLTLDDARGTTLRVTRGTLWITQDHDPRDIVLNAGDVWTIERQGRTVVEAQGTSILCWLGTGAVPVRAGERRVPAFERALAWLWRIGSPRLQRPLVPY